MLGNALSHQYGILTAGFMTTIMRRNTPAMKIRDMCPARAGNVPPGHGGVKNIGEFIDVNGKRQN
jgi:hypothetical protein